MSVEIDPVELGFRRPFTVEVGQLLKIKNPNTAPVAFKVKTTAPKQYCVRPNSGRIEPGHEVEVTVLLQAMKAEPPSDTRCRDKFLVQSIPITGDKEFTNVQQIWESVDKSSVQEKKIRVNWLPASEEGLQAGGAATAATPIRRSLANGVEATPDAPPPAYSSPSENNESAANGAEMDKKEPLPEDEPAPAPVGVPAAAVAAVKSTAESATTGAKEILAQTEEKITAATTGVAAGLRQRKQGGGTTSDEQKSARPAPELAQAVRQGTEGVPVQIVAVLCLLSFLLAYFFF